MRQIATLPEAHRAERFAAYLVTRDIPSHVEQEGGEWAIWVRNEDQIPQARAELEDFLRNPDDGRYQGVHARAAAKEQQERKRREDARRNVVEIGGRWRQGAGGGFAGAPLTWTLIGLSCFVAFLTELGTSRQSMRYLLFADPAAVLRGIATDGATDGFRSIREGEVWRLVTPIFIHFGWMHLLFNMYMLHSLGRRIEGRYGAWRMGLMILAVALTSNTLQAYWEGSLMFGGMSGVVYGLFGFMWMKTLFDPRSNLHLDGQTIFILLAWMFFCMAIEMPGLRGMFGSLRFANTAHFIGLVTGMLIGVAPLAWQKR